jgi:hypothetical protein
MINDLNIIRRVYLLQSSKYCKIVNNIFESSNIERFFLYFSDGFEFQEL